MSEAQDNGTAEAQRPQQELSIQRIYTKDISFETPNSPAVFTEEWKPQMDLNIGTETTKIADDVYEIVLKITVTVKAGEKTAFLTEVHQAGIFTIRGVDDNQLAPIFGITCPNILFPYVREVVSDLVSRGSFPQLLLSPINFEALFAQKLQQQQQEKQAQH